MDTNLVLVGAALAIGLAGLGVTLGEGIVAKTSLDALGKNPDLAGIFKKITILGIALVESAAIYGLIMALLIIYSEATPFQAIAAGLAIGLPGFAAGLGEGRVVASAIKSILRNPGAEKEITNSMILFIALVESAAIYGLIVSLLILYK
ncbi:MAG TPA: ATP synthase F0 subunit C [Candidatus Absconditabacterales bacterium]|nr:ATP synthase F0 subunit C [Candidatus Absconditabacterales bacterium]